jgi:hypothetical protein
MKYLLATASSAALAAGLLAATPARAVTVSATDAVYNYAAIVAGGGSTDAVVVTIAPGTSELTFTGFSGAASLTPGYASSGDGFTYPGLGGPSSVTGLAGLSGLIAPNEGFLTGAFLNGNEALPGEVPPATLDLTGAGAETFLSIAPVVDQVFFIGDGLTGTGTGTVQQFIVPAGAMSIALGFVDANGFEGTPSAYFDNTGSLQFNVNFIPAVPVNTPEPGSLSLLSAGLAGLLRKRLRRFR